MVFPHNFLKLSILGLRQKLLIINSNQPKVKNLSGILDTLGREGNKWWGGLRGELNFFPGYPCSWRVMGVHSEGPSWSCFFKRSLIEGDKNIQTVPANRSSFLRQNLLLSRWEPEDKSCLSTFAHPYQNIVSLP